MTSMGLPGVPLWQKNPGAANAQPVTPTSMGFTPEEAAKFGGPVLVEPSASGGRGWRYRWYPVDANRCQQDLDGLMQTRAQYGTSGPAPYCTDHPTAPPSQGSAFIF